jgi:hypothetical protein
MLTIIEASKLARQNGSTKYTITDSDDIGLCIAVRDPFVINEFDTHMQQLTQKQISHLVRINQHFY